MGCVGAEAALAGWKVATPSPPRAKPPIKHQVKLERRIARMVCVLLVLAVTRQIGSRGGSTRQVLLGEAEPSLSDAAF
jgi:hypothetical protein